MNTEIKKALEDYGNAMSAYSLARQNTIKCELEERATRKAVVLARENLHAVERDELGF